MSFALFLAKKLPLVLAKSFALFFAKTLHLFVSPLLNGAEFTLSVAKNVPLSKQLALVLVLLLSNGETGIEAPKQTIEFPAAPFCLIVCLFICLFKVGISTGKTVYLKRSYAKGKKKKRKKRRKVIRW